VSNNSALINEPTTTSKALGCGMDITGDANVDHLLNQFTNVANDACIYGCYASILYEHSAQKFIDAKKAGTDIWVAISNFLTRNAVDPTEGMSMALIDQIKSMAELYANAATNAASAAANAFKDQSWTDILFGLIKTVLSRYGKQIIMAAIQSMVDEMESEIQNRSDLLTQMRTSLDRLESALEVAAQYDWWDEFVQAVQEADLELADARRNFSRAYDSSKQGNWDTTNIDRGVLRLSVARQKLSSAKDVQDFVLEWEGGSLEKPYLPFDSMFRPVKAAPLWGALDIVSEELKAIKSSWECLGKTTLRLQQLRGFIMAAEGTIKWMESQVGINMSLDLVMSDAVIGGVVNSIADIQRDMRRVLEENNRLTAPVSLAAWKTEIKSQVELLGALGIKDGGWGELHAPWGMEAHGEENTALEDLQRILHSNGNIYVMTMDQWDFSATFVSDIVGQIMRSAGDIVSLVANKPLWNANLQRAKTSINQLAQKDSEAVAMLHSFSGHESDKYDYLLQLMDSAGMDGAKTMAMRAQMINIMQATTIMGVGAGGALACLSSMFGDRTGMSVEAQAAIEEMYDTQLSDAKATVRSLNILPSLQLKSLNVLQMQINDALDEMALISNMAAGGC